MADQSWHYITAGGAQRMPRRHIFLDTEARTRRDGVQSVQTWRCAVAAYRQAAKGAVPKEHIRAYTDAGALWDDIDGWCKPKSRTVLWTHNLSYDVRISDALEQLPRRGWTLDGWNMMPQGTWLIWRQDGRSLTMVDAASVFPTTLAHLAPSFQRTKLPLPDNGAGIDQWTARCLRDVQILRDAIVAYLHWIEREKLGSWQLTGTGQSYAAFRARFLTHRMLVHWDDEARAAERVAIWAGRTEAYFHGVVHRARTDEWDLTAAYPRIAARHDVPVELVRTLGPDADIWSWIDRGGYAVLAEIVVDTYLPLVPTALDGRILWPVGTFDTTLWDPELSLLRDRGARVQVRRAWVYRAEPALQAWATWVLGIRGADDRQAPAWVKLVVQHWGRALIGRWAMQRTVWEYLGRAPSARCRWWTQRDLDTGERGDLVQVGYGLWQSAGVEDWPQSMVAITGWITSQCRAQLTLLLLAVPPQVALYCDTDSLLVRAQHHHLLARLARQHPEWGLRVKRSWRRVAIHGPRQIVTGAQVRVSGVPVKAVKMPDGSLAGEVWQSLRTAVHQRHPAQVRITPRRWRLRDLDRRRDVGPDGWTEPIRLGSQ